MTTYICEKCNETIECGFTHIAEVHCAELSGSRNSHVEFYDKYIIEEENQNEHNWN